MFAEPAGSDFFTKLRKNPRSFVPAQFSVEPTAEKASLMAKSEEHQLLMICGRQIATKERLEVLALGTDKQFEDNECLGDTMRRVRESGAIPVLNWGFGKWWSSRGVLVREFVNNASPGDFFLGDTGRRLKFAREPASFPLARSKQIGIIAGSDPLPFPRHVKTAGSYGFFLTGVCDENRPVQSLKEILYSRDNQLVHYGEREGLAAFLRDQITMQLGKLGGYR
jgi:hypothetical protein